MSCYEELFESKERCERGSQKLEYVKQENSAYALHTNLALLPNQLDIFTEAHPPEKTAL